MRYLIDTNVILELVLQREQVEVAEKLISHLRNEQHDLFMTAGGFYGMIYTIDNYLRKVMNQINPERTETLRSIMILILNMFEVAEHDKQSLLQGITDDNFSDLEDSCQYQAAKKIGCHYFLTFNIKDYQGDDNTIMVLTPQQYMDITLNDEKKVN